MTTKEDLTTKYFCWVCGQNPEDTPKILKRFKPEIYHHILHCGNCETYFILDCDNYPKRISEGLVKWFKIV